MQKLRGDIKRTQKERVINPAWLRPDGTIKSFIEHERDLKISSPPPRQNGFRFAVGPRRADPKQGERMTEAHRKMKPIFAKKSVKPLNAPQGTVSADLVSAFIRHERELQPR
jgi:hypothetical protein